MGNTLGGDTSDRGLGSSKQATTTSAAHSDLNSLSFGRSNDFTEAARLKATFRVGTQVEIGGASFVVLDYYRDPQNKDTVLLGIPGERERLSRFEVNALKYAKHVHTLDPESCNLMLKTQEAKSLAITFAHRVRCERREDPNATPIPFLRNKPELRYDLFKAIAPILAPQLVQGKVEDATILALVRDFFDRRLPPQKQHETQPALPNLQQRHIHFPDAPTESGRIEFDDKLVPVTVEGLDGHPVQVVTREFVAAELEKRRPESDTVPLRRAEVKAWLQKHVEPYPMRVILHGERSSNAGQAYLLSDVLIALRDQPVRTQAPRLDESGRARIDVAGVPTEVVSLGALCSYREVPSGLVGDLLSRLQIDPVAGVELREHVLERKHKVYPAESAEPIVSLLSSKDGVAIPVSSHEAPFRVATTLPAFAAKIGQRNVYALERSLKEHNISPVKLNELGVPVEDKGRPFGRLTKPVYEASVPESHQKRLVMTDDQGALLAFTGKSIKDTDQLYWLDQLEAYQGTS